MAQKGSNSLIQYSVLDFLMGRQLEKKALFKVHYILFFDFAANKARVSHL